MDDWMATFSWYARGAWYLLLCVIMFACATTATLIAAAMIWFVGGYAWLIGAPTLIVSVPAVGRSVMLFVEIWRETF